VFPGFAVTPRIKRFLGRGGLLIATSMVCLGLMECGTRIVSPQVPSWLDIYREHPALPFYALQPNIDRLANIGESPFRVRTDAEGFRIALQGPPRSELSEVLVLGDSFTFGQGVSYEDSFVGLLNETQTRRYVNTGVGGYGPVQYEALFRHLVERSGHRPGAVLVVTFMGNDFQDCVWNKNRPVVDGIVGGEVSLRSWVKRNFHLYRLVSSAYHQLAPRRRIDRYPREMLYRPEAWQEDELLVSARPKYDQAFQSLSAQAEGLGIPILVAISPTREAVDALRGEHELAGDPRLPATYAKRAFARHGISTIDLTPIFVTHDSRDTYLQFDGHLTPFGHRLVADAVADQLEPPK
jgi:hypothetical protein